MANAGFEIYNDQGVLQVGDQKPALVLRAKGTHSTLTGAQAAPVGSRSMLTLTDASSRTLLAMRPRNATQAAYFSVYQNAFAGSTLYVSIFCNSATEQLLDWYMFDAPVNQTPLNFGLEIRDQNGVLTYHNALRPLRVVSFLNDYTAEGVAAIAVAESGRTLAAVQGPLAGFRRWDPGAQGNINRYWQQSYWMGVARNQNGLVLGASLMDRATTPVLTSPLGTTLFNPYNYLIVDVTGY